MKQWFFIIICHLALSTVHAAGSLDSMSPSEKKACGIEKLSDAERDALQAWMKVQDVPKPLVIKKNKIVHGTFTIKEVQDLGHFVLLDNGLRLNIYSRSRKKTMAWKPGDTVELEEPIKPKSFKLTNSSKKQTVAAKEQQK